MPNIGVLFASTRSGSAGVWIVGVDGRRATGQPRLVKANIERLQSLGVTRDGRFYCHVIRGGVDVHLASLDPATGGLRGTIGPLAGGEPGVRRQQGTWGPDSRRVVFFRAAPNQPTSVVVMDSITGSSQSYPVPIHNLERPAWHPEGQRILMLGRDDKNQEEVFELDLRNGRAIRLAGPTNNAEYSSDGRSLVYRRARKADSPAVVVRRDLASGQETVVFTGPGGFHLSPDSQSLLLFRRNNASLWIAPMGGEARPVLQGIHAPANEFVISHDGRHAYYVTTNPWEVWRVSIAGGPPQKLGINLEGIDHLSTRPDGASLTVSGGVAMMEVWVWENVR